MTSFGYKGGVEGQAVANMAKTRFPINTYNFWQQSMISYHSRLENEPTGTTEYDFCVICKQCPNETKMLKLGYEIKDSNRLT